MILDNRHTIQLSLYVCGRERERERMLGYDCRSKLAFKFRYRIPRMSISIRSSLSLSLTGTPVLYFSSSAMKRSLTVANRTLDNDPMSSTRTFMLAVRFEDLWMNSLIDQVVKISQYRRVCANKKKDSINSFVVMTSPYGSTFSS